MIHIRTIRACLLGIIFLIGSIFWTAYGTPSISAHETGELEESSAPQAQNVETASTSGVVSSEYILPYPGMLPDNPLYIIKSFRDKILEALIVDPMKKTEFYILMGDKKLAMAMLLFDKNNQPLGRSLLKESTYAMQRALETAQAFQKTGNQVPGNVVDILGRATHKHMDVVEALTERSNEDEKQLMKEILDSLKGIHQASGELK